MNYYFVNDFAQHFFGRSTIPSIAERKTKEIKHTLALMAEEKYFQSPSSYVCVCVAENTIDLSTICKNMVIRVNSDWL